MPIGQALGQSMAETASYAMLARSMDKQADRIAEAEQSLEDMTAYAKRLQRDFRTLYDMFMKHDALLREYSSEAHKLAEQNQALEQQNRSLIQQNQELEQRNKSLEHSVALLNANGEEAGELFVKQVAYMKELKIRLAQTEKALVHSSGRSVGMAHLKDFLLQATTALENHKEISEQAMEVMDRAYDQFMESGQLTPDEEMQKVLDELKIKAPDFKPGLAN